jgi:hypothetical protein
MADAAAERRTRQEGLVRLPPTLAQKVGKVRLDDSRLAAAERALSAVVALQPDLVGGEVRALRGLWRAAVEAGDTRRLFLAVHDLSGIGTTFGQPLVTALCRSLCRVLRGYDSLRGEPARLVEAHLDALEMVIACAIVATDTGPGRTLLDELEAAFARLTR